MAANPVIEKRDLLLVLSQENPIALIVRVAITGEVQVNVTDGGVTFNVLLQPPAPNGTPRIYDLLGFAPITAWRHSSSLMRAVESGYLFVDVEPSIIQAPSLPTTTPSTEGCCGIPPPPNPLIGDFLVWNGSSWDSFTPGAVVNNPSITGVAGEALAAGQLVAIDESGGVPLVFKADAFNASGERHNSVGYNITAALIGNIVTIRTTGAQPIADVLWDSVPAISDAGKPVFMSTVGGNSTLTPPSTIGTIVQRVGILTQGGTGMCSVSLQIGDGTLI